MCRASQLDIASCTSCATLQKPNPPEHGTTQENPNPSSDPNPIPVPLSLSAAVTLLLRVDQGGAFADLVASSVLDLSEGEGDAADDVTGSSDVSADAGGGGGAGTASVLHSALGIRTRPLDESARRKVSGGGGEGRGGGRGTGRTEGGREGE